MRAATRPLAFLALFALAAGCAGQQPSAESGARVDRNLLTAEQLSSHSYQNAYEAVEALRTNWLKPRGSDSFNSPSVVLVYLDNVKLGGVETLRGLPLANILVIRHYDANQANARWGVGHASGVIQVTTLPTGAAAGAPPGAGR
jgi:hypothetical protein